MSPDASLKKIQILRLDGKIDRFQSFASKSATSEDMSA